MEVTKLIQKEDPPKEESDENSKNIIELENSQHKTSDEANEEPPIEKIFDLESKLVKSLGNFVIYKSGNMYWPGTIIFYKNHLVMSDKEG